MSTNTIKIGNTEIGPDLPTYIIGEIGINHNGDISIAKKLIDVASDAGVNAVKFQKRDLQSLYQEDVLENTNKYEQNFQYMIPILKKVTLSDEKMKELKDYSEKKNLEFLCTPFDIKSALLLKSLNVNAYKVSSADLTNIELIEHLTKAGKPLILSTGMSYWDEIEQVVSYLKLQNASFALLHCRSVYPVWPREVNLKMINKLRGFGVPVGYSGHDIGIKIPLIAASMGACIIEKHITLDKKKDGPDHKISLEPYELDRLVRDIRIADQAMGKDNRFLLRGEILNRELFGKSLIAGCDIPENTEINREMIVVKGPGKGLSPNRIDNLVGKKAKRNILKNDFFIEEDLTNIKDQNFAYSFRSKWGLIARFGDFNEMVKYNPDFIEFHLAEKDLDEKFIPEKKYDLELVVHAPEYMGNKLFDLCSSSQDILDKSIGVVEKTIEITQNLAPFFKGNPKIIIHPGAMSLVNKLSKENLRQTFIESTNKIDSLGFEILPENLPPYPWYFGGQWKGNYFMDADEIKSFCDETEMKICFDLSHAALYCNAKNINLEDYIKTILPYTRHIHFADGYGLDGEGVQIGEGDIDFNKIMPIFNNYKETWVPEIWRGHLINGQGFLIALEKLAQYEI